MYIQYICFQLFYMYILGPRLTQAPMFYYVLWMFCIPHKPFKLKKPLNALTWLKTEEMMGKSKHVLSRSWYNRSVKTRCNGEHQKRENHHPFCGSNRKYKECLRKNQGKSSSSSRCNFQNVLERVAEWGKIFRWSIVQMACRWFFPGNGHHQIFRRGCQAWWR